MSECRSAGRVGIRLADGVAHVRLERPEKLNALDARMFDAIVAAGARLAGERGLRAVVLSGQGRGFCAGLDIESFAGVARQENGEAGGQGDIRLRTHDRSNLFQRAALVWRDLPVPVIAALHGAVFGGGLQIALAADMRYAAPDAKLAVLETKWGLVPDMGGILLMRRLMRADVVRDLTYTGRIVSGIEAQSLGLVTAIHADPLAAAFAAAHEIAARSPDALRAAKALLNGADDHDAAQVLTAESDAQARLIGSPNQKEAVRAALARRAAMFRDPEATHARDGQKAPS